MPTRLVDVGASGMSRRVRLCESSGLPSGTPYVTLSHRWGSKQFLCLRTENRLSLETMIPLAKLRKVFRDAIQLTRSMGIRYLWIDSLCIIQDSEADWTREAGMMSAVYANGACNLAATGDPDGGKGLFARRQPSLLKPIPVELDSDIYLEEDVAFPRGQYFLVEADPWKEDIDDAPLNQRGWVMQERMLSPRSLHFGARQLFWECYEMEACEVFPRGLPGQMRRTNAKKLLSAFPSAALVNRLSFGHPMTRAAAQSYRLQESRIQWYQIVNAYTQRCLTQESDKLIAVAGLAAVMRNFLRCRYLAGMWEENLINQLGWMVSEPRPRPRAYRCPSWSWASVDSRVEMPDGRSDDKRSTALANILQAHVIPAGHNDLGAIRDGSLVIAGHLGLMRLYHYDELAPGETRLSTLDWWLDDRIYLDASGTEFPLCGWRRFRAFHVTEFRIEDLDLEYIMEESPWCFFMPLTFHERADGLRAKVVGLLLHPTGSAPWEFRRIGMFEAYKKDSIAMVKGPLGNIGQAHYMSKTGDDVHTICIK